MHICMYIRVHIFIVNNILTDVPYFEIMHSCAMLVLICLPLRDEVSVKI